MITTKDLCMRFPDGSAIRYGDLCFEAGQTYALLGASGCGKSMTLKALAGILTPDEGRIELGDRVLFDSRAGINVPARERGIGYLFQGWESSGKANVSKLTISAGEGGRRPGAGLRGGKKEIRAKVEAIMERLRLTQLSGHFPSQMSGGQQQRVALARILVRKPEVILLDEPFSALDAYMQDAMQQELMEILSEYDGITVMVSHDRDILYRFSEKLFVMGQGCFLRTGTVKEIFAEPVYKEAAMLTGCKNIARAVRRDDHTIDVVSWGITLHTSYILPSQFSYIGYRAHNLVPVYGERRENCIRFAKYEKAELPFEVNYYVAPEKEEWKREEMLSWFVQREDWPLLREKGVPDYLQFQEDK